MEGWKGGRMGGWEEGREDGRKGGRKGGWEEGKEEGKEEGRKAERQKGRKEGRTEGRKIQRKEGGKEGSKEGRKEGGEVERQEGRKEGRTEGKSAHLTPFRLNRLFCLRDSFFGFRLEHIEGCNMGENGCIQTTIVQTVDATAMVVNAGIEKGTR
jgi:hypothetical protein